MAQDQFLDARNTALILRIACIVLVAGAFTFGCAWPKILVLTDPLTPEEHLNLGVIYEKNNEFDAALKEYRAAAVRLPVSYMYMGNVYFAKGELGKAEESYRKAVDADPGNADARNNLAWLYFTMKINLEEAESLVLKAIQLNPAKAAVYGDTLEAIRKQKR